MSVLIGAQKRLRSYATKERAKNNAWFFKTGKGQYGEGDQFIGVTVPNTRVVAHEYIKSPLKDIKVLLSSKIHEDRLLGLLILVGKYQKGTDIEKQKITAFYRANKKCVNNWDLVDTSASYILGASLYKKDTSVLYKLVTSKSLWDRRIAIISTLYFIKQKNYTDTLALSVILMKDKEDLMHKAVGWMLREVGKQDEKVLRAFLDQYAKVMPRTALRYSIERLSPTLRKAYMKKY